MERTAGILSVDVIVNRTPRSAADESMRRNERRGMIIGMPTRRFAYRIGRRSLLLLRLFGVSGPEDAWVDLDDDSLTARFGWARVTTPIANITGWRIEGPWRWITAIGIRRSIRHADITFGGSHRGGVRLDFRDDVRIGPLKAPAVYLTVEDLEGFAAALTELGINGTDARKRR